MKIEGDRGEVEERGRYCAGPPKLWMTGDE